ncbi:hypothetical protein HBB16_01220 [Pseudonocardia sp. MCCB 268]|nr:hypothetical protein [Pseudonocardia cytotoxica]
MTNNHYTYNVDDRDTIADNSINQNIDTGGGDFNRHRDQLGRRVRRRRWPRATTSRTPRSPPATTTSSVTTTTWCAATTTPSRSATATPPAPATSPPTTAPRPRWAATRAGSHDASGSFNDTENTTTTTTDVRTRTTWTAARTTTSR